MTISFTWWLASYKPSSTAVFLWEALGRKGILIACAYYWCAVQSQLSGGVGKDWGCIRKHPLCWLSRLALNSCSSLFYVAACLCVGGKKKKSKRMPLGSKSKGCSADCWSGFPKEKQVGTLQFPCSVDQDLRGSFLCFFFFLF